MDLDLTALYYFHPSSAFGKDLQHAFVLQEGDPASLEEVAFLVFSRIDVHPETASSQVNAWISVLFAINTICGRQHPEDGLEIAKLVVYSAVQQTSALPSDLNMYLRQIVWTNARVWKVPSSGKGAFNLDVVEAHIQAVLQKRGEMRNFKQHYLQQKDSMRIADKDVLQHMFNTIMSSPEEQGFRERLGLSSSSSSSSRPSNAAAAAAAPSQPPYTATPIIGINDPRTHVGSGASAASSSQAMVAHAPQYRQKPAASHSAAAAGSSSAAAQSAEDDEKEDIKQALIASLAVDDAEERRFRMAQAASHGAAAAAGSNGSNGSGRLYFPSPAIAAAATGKGISQSRLGAPAFMRDMQQTMTGSDQMIALGTPVESHSSAAFAQPGNRASGLFIPAEQLEGMSQEDIKAAIAAGQREVRSRKRSRDAVAAAAAAGSAQIELIHGNEEQRQQQQYQSLVPGSAASATSAAAAAAASEHAREEDPPNSKRSKSQSAQDKDVLDAKACGTCNNRRFFAEFLRADMTKWLKDNQLPGDIKSLTPAQITQYTNTVLDDNNLKAFKQRATTYLEHHVVEMIDRVSEADGIRDNPMKKAALEVKTAYISDHHFDLEDERSQIRLFLDKYRNKPTEYVRDYGVAMQHDCVGKGVFCYICATEQAQGIHLIEGVRNSRSDLNVFNENTESLAIHTMTLESSAGYVCFTCKQIVDRARQYDVIRQTPPRLIHLGGRHLGPRGIHQGALVWYYDKTMLPGGPWAGHIGLVASTTTFTVQPKPDPRQQGGDQAGPSVEFVRICPIYPQVGAFNYDDARHLDPDDPDFLLQNRMVRIPVDRVFDLSAMRLIAMGMHPDEIVEPRAPGLSLFARRSACPMLPLRNNEGLLTMNMTPQEMVVVWKTRNEQDKDLVIQPLADRYLPWTSPAWIEKLGHLIRLQMIPPFAETYTYTSAPILRLINERIRELRPQAANGDAQAATWLEQGRDVEYIMFKVIVPLMGLLRDPSEPWDRSSRIVTPTRPYYEMSLRNLNERDLQLHLEEYMQLKVFYNMSPKVWPFMPPSDSATWHSSQDKKLATTLEQAGVHVDHNWIQPPPLNNAEQLYVPEAETLNGGTSEGTHWAKEACVAMWPNRDEANNSISKFQQYHHSHLEAECNENIDKTLMVPLE
jgi:hypothetical protein